MQTSLNTVVGMYDNEHSGTPDVDSLTATFADVYGDRVTPYVLSTDVERPFE